MNKLWRRLSGAAISALAVIMLPIVSLACTAVYVGSGASTDGTTIIARSNDYPDMWPNYLQVTDAVQNEPGRTMPVDSHGTVLTELPADTYHYTSTPWMDSALSENGLQRDAAACTNEKGVVMTMSVTAFTNKAALAADPLVQSGLTEFTANDLVICQSATAREAVKVLTGLIDTYGSSECNIAFIADQQEAWYVEMYSGHQYAAVKLPADKVAVIGNEFTMEYLSDYEEAVVSPGLETLARDNGFAVYGENGELNLLDTYSGDEEVADYSHMRTWIGHLLLSPETTPADYARSDRYPLTFSADHAVSLQEVMSVIRNRYEGTAYSPDETGRTDMRVIGTDTALNVHILQIDPGLPADMSCVTWETVGPAIYGVFVPLSNLSASVSESYGRNQPAGDYGRLDTTYPWYTFKELNTLCVNNTEVLGAPVRAFWAEAEEKMIARMTRVLHEAAAMEHDDAVAYVTEYCNAMQEQAFQDGGSILNSVRWYMSKICNTMKNGRNPETHEVLDELAPIAPVTLTVTTQAYD